jgi:hypothetical protein
MRYAPALLLLLAAAGCGVETDDRPVSFTYIHEAILVPSCATAACHSSQNQRENLDLGDRDSAYRLFNEGVGDHTASAIFQTIGGDSQPVVQPYAEAGRMPLDSPLPDADIQLIGTWIDQGEANN